MPGRRHKHFRSGDLNEELGIVLLKGIAAVAEVPRPEDVGIDAVATLLREGPDNFLIAEDSFYVQFKSSSVRKVKYSEHEVRWLESLKLPFFIGSVRKADAAIDLFATHRLSKALLERPYNEIELALEPKMEAILGSLDTEVEDIIDDYRCVNVGPPLLSWSVSDLADSGFTQQAYAVLKPYLEAEQRNVDYRGIRYIEVIEWVTNEPPRCKQGSMHFQSFGCDEEIQRVFRSMAPHIVALWMRVLGTNDRQLLEVILQLVNYMRDNGFDPDPHRIYDSFYRDWDELKFPNRLMNRDDSSHPSSQTSET